jgi:restriction system protein
MAEITRERAGEIVPAAFEVLADHPDGMQVRRLIEEVKSRLPLTDYERGTYEKSPGSIRFDKILRFSTIQAVKAGWLIKSKGNWTLTDEGRAADARYTDPGDFMRESYRLYAEWRRAQPDHEQEDLTDEIEDATATATLEEAEEAAWGEIEDFLRQMPPYEFQDLVAALLRAMGYHVAWVSPPGPDKGIDILAYTDPLGAEGPRIKVQVKRRNDQKTTVDDLRSFMAVLSDQDVGIYVATGGFTSDTSSEARQQESRRITLLGLQDLFDLWVKYYEGMDDTDRQRLPLQPVYFLAGDD